MVKHENLDGFFFHSKKVSNSRRREKRSTVPRYYIFDRVVAFIITTTKSRSPVGVREEKRILIWSL